MTIRIASRGSRLALWQASAVRDAIAATAPEIETRIEVIHTRGDRILDTPLARVGGKGLFVKEIEDALLSGAADVAVHSLKDVPASVPAGLVLAAFTERDVPFDAFVSDRFSGLSDLPAGARVGTSSLRRTAQILACHPDLAVVPLRGNVETRLRRLQEGLDAVILAAAGLRRLGLKDRIRTLLGPPDFIPAVGQGVIAVQCRSDDATVTAVLGRLDHEQTRIAVLAERAFLATMGGGCQVPLGAYAQVSGGTVTIAGFVGRPDGSVVLRDRLEAGVSDAERAGRLLATALLDAGGRQILETLGSENPG